MNPNTTHIKTLFSCTWLLYAIIAMQTLFYLYTIPALQTTLSIARFLVFAFVVCVFARYHSSNKLSFQLLIYFLIFFICTFLGKGNLTTIASTFINTLTLLFLIEYDAQQDLKACVHKIALVFSFIVYINFICIIIAPGGIIDNTYYLLGGNYNQMGISVFMASFINLFYSTTWKTGYVNTLLTLIAATVSPLIVGSMTSVVGMLLIWFYAFCKTDHAKRVFIITLTTIYVIFQTSIVFFGNQISSSSFAKFIVQNVLHKSLTFSNRTNVWIYTKKMITESWIYGYGTHNQAWYESASRLTVAHAHNIFLQVLLDGGILLMVPFIIMLTITVVSILKSNLHTKYDLLLGLLVIFFMMMMEVYPLVMILFILLFIYYVTKYAEKI